MKEKIRVGIIFGGRSGEHEVSMLSAASVIDAIDKNRYEVVPIYISREGKWLPPASSEKALMLGKAEPETTSVAIIGDPTLTGLIEVREGSIPTAAHSFGALDVLFPILHGTYGEDGTVQGLLELANIPYVGAGVMASSVGMDKEIMKDIFRAKDLPVVDYLMVKRKEWEKDKAQILGTVEAGFAYPCFVKPVNLGSSVGISRADNREELTEALNLAARYDRKLIVEAGVNAREIECSVLGNDEPIASVPGEVIPQKKFYDYEAKYFDDKTQLVIPADIPPETTAQVQDMAVRAFKAVDCAGLARIDFFLTRDTQKLFVNEINTIPGFTKTSMYPRLWQASGVSYGELIDRLLELALERHRDKNRSLTTYNR